MKTERRLLGALLIALCLYAPRILAQPPFPSGGGSLGSLNSWSFSNTNWLSDRGNHPLAYTNIYIATNAGNGNALWLDTTNLTPAYLFYRVIETNGFTNINCATGSVSLWFRPDWSSTNLAGGTGPGNWGNLISLGETNSFWWSLYLSPDGCTVYFSSQTNGGSPATYFTAPVSLSNDTWYNLVLTYGPTNSAFYTNGILATNGTGVAYVPGTNVTFFAIGSDSNGLYQAGGLFDDVATYSYQLDPTVIGGDFSVFSLVYYGRPVSYDLTNAPSTNTAGTTNFSAVTGAGFITAANGLSTNQHTSSNIWFTTATNTTNVTLTRDFSATVVSSNVMTVTFAIDGGTNGALYDVFGTGALTHPLTNAVWVWMGQGYHWTNYTMTITNPPSNGIYLLLGKPQDTDQDGLTDAYELLVSHTDPNNPDSSGSGMLDGWQVLFGLDPNSNSANNSNLRLNYTYDPVGRLDVLTGTRSEGLTNDFEGNVLLAH